MSPGSNNIWPLVVLLGLAALASATAFSPLDPACAPGALDRCTRATIVDDFDVLDGSIWVSESHSLGQGGVHASHASHVPGMVRLTLPAGTREGSEIRSRRRGRFRTAEARIRTPDAPGALVGFFLYQGVRGTNDEIDVEIFAGERRIMFTTWIAGTRTNHVKRVLPFDPAEDFHDYRIEWSRDSVGFFVDGERFASFDTGVPEQPMFLMTNAFWPHWLDGPAPSEPLSLEIEHLAF